MERASIRSSSAPSAIGRVTLWRAFQNFSGGISAQDGLGMAGGYELLRSGRMRPSVESATALQLLEPMSTASKLIGYILTSGVLALSSTWMRCNNSGIFSA